MTMRLFGDHSIQAKREEVKLLRELSKYYTNIEIDLKDEKTLEKLKNDLYRLFEIKIKSIGLEPYRDDNARDTFIKSPFENPNRVSFGVSSSFEKSNGAAGGGSRLKAINGEYYDTSMYILLSEKKLIEEIKTPKNIYKYIEGLYHEINHIKQKILVRKRNCSLETFRYTYDSILAATKENWYRENYYTAAFELDSYSNYDILAGIPSNLFNTEKEAIRALRAGYYRSRARQNDPIKRNELESQNDKKITAEDIKNEPLLAKKFNPDGTLKTVEQLINDMEEERFKISNAYSEKDDKINENKEMEEAHALYFELIDQAIQREKPSIEDLDDYRYYTNIDLYKDMADYFDKQNKQITNYYRKYNIYQKYEKNRKYELTPIEEINEYYQKRISYLLDVREKCGEKEENVWSWPEDEHVSLYDLFVAYKSLYHPKGENSITIEELHKMEKNLIKKAKKLKNKEINESEAEENKDSKGER